MEGARQLARIDVEVCGGGELEWAEVRLAREDSEEGSETV